jgi:hypothetical protein
MQQGGGYRERTKKPRVVKNGREIPVGSSASQNWGADMNSKGVVGSRFLVGRNSVA